MSIQFPSSPSLNQTYTLGTKTWVWNGYAWDIQITAGSGGGGNTDITPAFDQANNSFAQANLAFDQANSANILAQSAYDFANTITAGITYTTSATAPVSPHTGDEWYNSATDITYVYSSDGVTNFWLDVTSAEVAVASGVLTDTYARGLAQAAFDQANTGGGGGGGFANTIIFGTSNVDIATANSNVIVSANGSTWTFDTQKNLTLPSGSCIVGGGYSDGIYWGNTGFNIRYESSAAYIDTEYYEWKFSPTGPMILSYNSRFMDFDGGGIALGPYARYEKGGAFLSSSYAATYDYANNYWISNGYYWEYDSNGYSIEGTETIRRYLSGDVYSSKTPNIFLWEIASGQGKVLGLDFSNNTDLYETTDSGVTWTFVCTLPNLAQGSRLAYNSVLDQWLVFGSDSLGSYDDYFATSSDGVTWTQQEIGTYPSNYSLESVTYNTDDGTWLITGTDYTAGYPFSPLTMTSTDGINWTANQTTDTFFDWVAFGRVTYGNSTYVTYQGNEIWTSSDGINWSLSPKANYPTRNINSFNDIAYSQYHGKFYITATDDGNGSAFVWTSPDGITWTKTTDFTPYELGDGTSFELNRIVTTTSVGTLVAFGGSAGGTSSAIAVCDDGYGFYISDGYYGTGQQSIGIGYSAGRNRQSNYAIALGPHAGKISQGESSLAIGTYAAEYAQGNNSITIGSYSGEYHQGDFAVAIGRETGQISQGQYAIAIGDSAGANTQGQSAVAIGSETGQISQGQYAVALGSYAGTTHQGNNSIIINATGTALEQTTANTLTIAPIREDLANTSNVLYYNTETKEVSVSPLKLKEYTANTLPTPGIAGRVAYVTDGLSPTYLSVIVGGGSVVTPVFDNGTDWVAH